MFSWGEDTGHCFGVKTRSGSNSARTEHGITFSHLKSQIKDVSASGRLVAFLKGDGSVRVIRSREEADGRTVRGRPKNVNHKEKIRAVGCGDDTAILLSENGNILSLDSSHVLRPMLPHIQVNQVACGNHHSLTLTKDGQVYVWGRDTCGQLGLGKGNPNTVPPTHLKCLSAVPVVQICAGGEHSFSLTLSGAVLGWGKNSCGQLGLGDTTDRNIPTPAHYLTTKKTVYITCGEDHTATLTKDGTVFTFGSGQHGQLGHNSLQNELRPRLVVELLGAKGRKIACGRHHTLVLTDSKKVYSFGLGEQGQLGRGAAGNQSVPLPVHLTHDIFAGHEVEHIYAGGNCSFAMCTWQQEPAAGAHGVSDGDVVQLSLDTMVDTCLSDSDNKPWKTTRKNDSHFQTSLTYSGLNMSLARAAFQKLVREKRVLAEVKNAIMQKLLPSLGEKPAGVEGLRVYLLLMELLWVLQKHEHHQSTELSAAVAAAIVRLPKDSLQVLGVWWLSLKCSSRIKHVEMWKQALSCTLTYSNFPRTKTLKDLLRVLQHLHEANKKIARPKRVEEKVFCLNFPFNPLFLGEDLELWRMMSSKQDGSEMLPALCHFPFLMDLECKKTVFEINAYATKMFGRFELWLCRASLVEDTFQQLLYIDHTTFKKALVVHLDGDPKTTNVYKTDFFLHLFDKLMLPESGMFMYNDSETLVWFPSKPSRGDERFFLFGVLCGLALHNSSIIHLPFPTALFKKLLNVEPSLEDLIEFSPSVGRSLQCILEDYEDDDIENLDMSFSIVWDGVTVELDPEIPEKPLTSQNKKEFADAYVNHCFNASVEEVFEKFRDGFLMVCDQDVVELFRPEELRQLMVGTESYDWGKLKKNTVYDNVYHAHHPTIEMFWEVFEELSEDQKKAFLLFLTGSDRVPVLGMDRIQMRVQVQPNSTQQHFPEALTCHSILNLPLYQTKERLRARFLEALSHNRGFFD
ncbi:probable E3 ubiquitin-protein ligase HERC3 isoform X2 [Lampris incognitus]|uniref:probable E3 ubiquitin-protein ligase HERC3 isoform X2 n=1 Tax=Lampris incognitus TaxID=2546036 RepID=UPI0024B5FE05|nr:probable E3 ubiquitin-protein ligase HERC3 isoform X2 [Lampris incognitus]